MIPWCAGDSVVCLQSSKSIAQVETGPILQMPGWPAWKQKCFYIDIGWEGTVDFVDVHNALAEFDVKYSPLKTHTHIMHHGHIGPKTGFDPPGFLPLTPQGKAS